MQPARRSPNRSQSTFSAVLALASLVFLPSVSAAQGPDKVAMPVAYPPGSEFTHSLTVVLTSATPDAVIRFTVDGSDPVTSPTAMVFLDALVFGNSATLKAVAIRNGMEPSQVMAATYTMIQPKVPNPIATPDPAFFQDSIIVRLEAPTPGARLFYTLDGSTPNRQSPQMTGEGLVLKQTTTLRVIAIEEGRVDSEVMTFVYVKYTVGVRSRDAAPGGLDGKATFQPRRPAWTWKGRRLDGSRP